MLLSAPCMLRPNVVYVICFIPLFICKEDQELFCKTVFDKLFSDEEIEHFNTSIDVYLKVMPDSRRNGFKTLIYY